MRRKRILFLLKNRSSYGVSYGLKNSCFFVSELLENKNYNCKIVEVIDTNSIDKEVHNFRPDFVIIEALWAEAKRLPKVFSLHPNVKKWTCRIHSKSSFLVHEGEAINMIKDYHELSEKFPKFTVSGNNSEFLKEIAYSTGIKLVYLPNIYLLDENTAPVDKYSTILDVGCFGSLRPMKGQLIQAMAAIGFAESQNRKLRFHVNGDRIEQRGENVYKNLISLFKQSKHELVFHKWQNHPDFLDLIRKMDVGMQVSFNESYNIIAADFISQYIPIVGSKEIKFLLPFYQADVNSIDDIISKLDFAVSMRKYGIHNLNRLLLKNSNKKAINSWLDFLK